MRVVIVGTSAARARLSEHLPDGVHVVGHARTVSDARRLPVKPDGYLVAPPTREELEDDYSVKEPLTPREVEVLELLAQGLPNKQIAVRLGISDQTVKFHVATICAKLGAHNRTEAARRALQDGIIPL